MVDLLWIVLFPFYLGSDMTGLVKDRLVLVWAGLVVATLVSFLVGHDHASIGTVGVVVALIIAFGKIRFVGVDFMELQGRAALVAGGVRGVVRPRGGDGRRALPHRTR